jgi:hypothetical protein
MVFSCSHTRSRDRRAAGVALVVLVLALGLSIDGPCCMDAGLAYGNQHSVNLYEYAESIRLCQDLLGVLRLSCSTLPTLTLTLYPAPC